MANIAEVRVSRIGLRRVTTALAPLAAFGLAVGATPAAKAQSFSVLYSFKGSPDGTDPIAALIMDNVGNLYGTTLYGGAFGNCPNAIAPNQGGCGTIFKLDTSGNETVLHSFTSSGGDGAFPYPALIMDQAGNLYGTTGGGGGTGSCPPGFMVPGCGTIFKLSPSVRHARPLRKHALATGAVPGTR